MYPKKFGEGEAEGVADEPPLGAGAGVTSWADLGTTPWPPPGVAGSGEVPCPSQPANTTAMTRATMPNWNRTRTTAPHEVKGNGTKSLD